MRAIITIISIKDLSFWISPGFLPFQQFPHLHKELPSLALDCLRVRVTNTELQHSYVHMAPPSGSSVTDSGGTHGTQGSIKCEVCLTMSGHGLHTQPCPWLGCDGACRILTLPHIPRPVKCRMTTHHTHLTGSFHPLETRRQGYINRFIFIYSPGTAGYIDTNFI